MLKHIIPVAAKVGVRQHLIHAVLVLLMLRVLRMLRVVLVRVLMVWMLGQRLVMVGVVMLLRLEHAGAVVHLRCRMLRLRLPLGLPRALLHEIRRHRVEELAFDSLVHVRDVELHRIAGLACCAWLRGLAGCVVVAGRVQ